MLNRLGEMIKWQAIVFKNIFSENWNGFCLGLIKEFVNRKKNTEMLNDFPND